MTRNTKIFLGACIASFALWLFLNSGMTALRQQFSSRAAAVEQPEETGPELKPGILSPDIQTKSAFVMYVASDNARYMLFVKEAEQKLPIASLTKLMTALVAMQFYGPEENIVVSLRAIQEEGDQGELFEGQNITAHDILYPLLLESSNDAAAALAEHKETQTFMNRMNQKAVELGLVQTSFVNPTGLDPVGSSDGAEPALNMSSAQDLALLVIAIKNEYPEILDISALPKFGPYTNTDKLARSNGWQTKVLGGKTGWTDLAKGSLILVLQSPESIEGQSPENKGYVVYVILGAENRFQEMKKLVDWTHEAYAW